MNRWKFAIITVIALFLISYFASNFFKDFSTAKLDTKIAVIPVYGAISSESGSGIFNMDSNVNPEYFEGALKKAEQDSSIKGVIIEINSPGGSVVPSKEMATMLKEFKKPKVAWIREVGASGAYWIASASDKIVADPLSITGSIGVYGSYLEFSGLMQKYGVGYEQLTSGEYKDSGTPFKKLSDNERALLQSKINLIYDYFVEDVATNRKMSKEELKKLADGSFYLGLEAVENGLVDELGSKSKAIEEVKKLANIKDAYIVEYHRTSGIASLFSNALAYSSFYMGKGFASQISTGLESNKINIET